MPISFEVTKELEGRLGRVGCLVTDHGNILTPAFLPVGTKATVKGVTPTDLSHIGIQGLLANTYHLYLQPGSEIIAKHKGLHQFMNWKGPIMTDSGGFQVFSLGAAFGKGVTKFASGEQVQQRGLNVYSQELATEHGKLAIIDEEGVTFTSHIDGSLHRFTAERSIEIQHQLGADIIVAFDECTSASASYEYQKEAMDRTHRWARRSLLAHKQNVTAALKQGLYGVVQGGRYLDLRRESAEILASMGFDGYGIGGSFTKEDLIDPLKVVNSILPASKPRHLLGIGEPEDIFIAVEAGCDTFDCVAPTRLGRVGTFYTSEGKIDIRRSRFKDDLTPLSEWCPLFNETTYTRSYVHHLFRSGEMLGSILATMSNLYFLNQLMRDIRQSIEDGSFDEFRGSFLTKYKSV